MTYICFVDLKTHSVPHMEPLSAQTPEEAFEEAVRLLRQHRSGVAAHVFHGERRLHSIHADQASA